MLQKADVAEVLAGERKRGRMWRYGMLALAATGVVLVAIAGWMWWSASSGPSAASLATETVKRGDIHVTLVATGTLAPTHEVSVGSLISGTIASVDVDYDQRVEKGQALAHLDMSDLESKLTRALAMVDAQTAGRDVVIANLADAKAALLRAQELRPGQTISQKDIDLATTAVRRGEANLAAAEAQLAAARADLDASKNDYDKGVIVAPIKGIVLAVNAEVGQTVAAAMGATIFVIASDLQDLELNVDIAEADVATVKLGNTASFTVEAAPDQPFAGVIRQVRSGPSVADGVVSYKAVISVPNDKGMLRPGMTATADIAVADALDVLSVPNTALRYVPAGVSGAADAGPHVYLLTDGKPRQVAVTTGLSDGQRTEITSGLAVGDVVITGSKVR